MAKAEARLMIGLLFGILGRLDTSPFFAIALTGIAICYCVAAAFTKEPKA